MLTICLKSTSVQSSSNDATLNDEINPSLGITMVNQLTMTIESPKEPHVNMLTDKLRPVVKPDLGRLKPVGTVYTLNFHSKYIGISVWTLFCCFYCTYLIAENGFMNR